jgi:hypothetical protein
MDGRLGGTPRRTLRTVGTLRLAIGIIAAEQCSLHEYDMSYLIVAHNFGSRTASFALQRKIFVVSCCTTFVDVVPNLACSQLNKILLV